MTVWDFLALLLLVFCIDPEIFSEVAKFAVETWRKVKRDAL